MTTRPLIALAIVAALIPLLVACGGKKAKSTPTPTPVPATSGAASSTPAAPPPPAAQPTTATTGSTGGASNELAAVTAAYTQIKSLRATISVEAPGAPATQASVEFVNPDKMHITANSPAGPFELIVIGADSYFKVGGMWLKQTAAGAGQIFDPKTIQASIQAFSAGGAVKGATANVGGKTCQLYTVANASGNQEFCVADNLPVRVVTQASGSKTTVIFSDYNANISITPPI